MGEVLANKLIILPSCFRDSPGRSFVSVVISSQHLSHHFTCDIREPEMPALELKS